MSEESESIESEGADPRLVRLFDSTRKRLVDTGTRNRLVHVNLANSRGKVVNLVNERSDHVYSILASGKNMRFRPLGRDRKKGEELDQEEILLVSNDDEDFDAGRYTDNQLETPLGPDALQKKLLQIARESRTAEEEQGINVLYLALGFLTWFEDRNSDVVRQAPLILAPVELVRNARTSTYDLKLRDDEVITNLPLQRRLADDFGIKLPEVEIDDDWSPSKYFDQVRSVIEDRVRWCIEPDAIQLGFFSFAKLLMFLDLSPDA